MEDELSPIVQHGHDQLLAMLVKPLSSLLKNSSFGQNNRPEINSSVLIVSQDSNA
jgi:hypothetical protein